MKRLTNEEGRKLLAKKARKCGTDKAHLWIAAWLTFSRSLLTRGIWQREYRFSSPRRWRFDWADPLGRVAVEVDGGRWAPGGGKHSSDADRDKLNAAAALGWRVFRFSPAQLTEDPEQCVRIVEEAL